MHNSHHTLAKITRHLAGEEATIALGAALAKLLAPGMKIYLSGDLGTGKTTLVRAMLRGLGYLGKVKSPTYTLVELYEVSRLNLYHFDFYRLNHPDEWSEAGLRDYFAAEAVCLVEWPEKVGALLPPPDIRIRLQLAGNARDAEIAAETEMGTRCLAQLQ